MKKPIIVLDLDGTLVETAGDLLASLNHVLVAHHLPQTNLDDLRRFVGQGGRVMLQRAFANANRTLDEETADRMVAEFVAHYGDNMPGQSHPFEGVMDALDALEAEGFVFAICTNKTEILAKRLLASLGIANRFAAICGGDTFPFKKPDPGHLFMTIEAAGGDPAKAIMVGDSAPDINAALAAKIPVIGVDFGYTDVPIGELHPDLVISHYREMTVDTVKSLLASNPI